MLVKWRQEVPEFKAILHFVAILRPAWGTRHPVLKKKKRQMAVVACIFNPSTGEAEADRPLEFEAIFIYKVPG